MGVYADVLQEDFLYFTYHGVGRIIDITHIVLDALTEQGMGAAGVKIVVRLKPAEDFRRSMLDTLVERSCIACRKDIGFVFAPWPEALLAL